MTTIVPIWNFDSIKADDTEHLAVLLYSRMTRAHSEGKKGLAKVVHRAAAHIQSGFAKDEIVTKKRAVSAKLDVFFKAEIAFITSEAAGDDQLSEHETRAYDAAARKVIATAGFGGDLTVHDTASKCEKFNKEQNLQKNQANAARELREEAGALAEQAGHAVGSEAYDKFVSDYIKENTPDDVEGGKSDENLNPNQVFGKKIGALLTQLEEAGITEKELLDVEQSITVMLGKKLEAIIANAAADDLLETA